MSLLPFLLSLSFKDCAIELLLPFFSKHLKVALFSPLDHCQHRQQQFLKIYPHVKLKIYIIPMSLCFKMYSDIIIIIIIIISIVYFTVNFFNLLSPTSWLMAESAVASQLPAEFAYTLSHLDRTGKQALYLLHLVNSEEAGQARKLGCSSCFSRVFRAAAKMV